METLRQFFESMDILEDIDVYVDGIDAIAVCGRPTFSEEGKREFKEALDLPVDGHCITSNSRKDFEDLDYYQMGEGDGGRLQLAWKLVTALAGYCSCEDYDKWFKA